MAREKTWTGRFAPCAAAEVLHEEPAGYVYTEVIRTKDRHGNHRWWIECACRSRCFLGPGWTDGCGLTLQQVLAKGAVVAGLSPIRYAQLVHDQKTKRKRKAKA